MTALWRLGLAMLLAPGLAAAQSPPVVWTGTYTCGQGVTALTLTVRPTGPGGAAEALFHFSADKSNPRVPEGCFSMTGTYNARRLVLHATDWLMQPPGYVTVDLDGAVVPDGQSVSGKVAGPNCTVFELTRAKRDPGIARCGRPTA